MDDYFRCAKNSVSLKFKILNEKCLSHKIPVLRKQLLNFSVCK